MSKSAKQHAHRAVQNEITAARSSQPAMGNADRANEVDPSSKQSRVIAMLQAPAGTTIAAIMKVTGWQQHSVRGFLAGVVRKRLKLKLGSKMVDSTRVYQIAATEGRKDVHKAKHQSA